MDCGHRSACSTIRRTQESAYMPRQHISSHSSTKRVYGVKLEPGIPQHHEQPRQWAGYWIILEFRMQRNQGQRDNKWPCKTISWVAYHGLQTSYRNVIYTDYEWISTVGGRPRPRLLSAKNTSTAGLLWPSRWRLKIELTWSQVIPK